MGVPSNCPWRVESLFSIRCRWGALRRDRADRVDPPTSHELANGPPRGPATGDRHHRLGTMGGESGLRTPANRSNEEPSAHRLGKCRRRPGIPGEHADGSSEARPTSENSTKSGGPTTSAYLRFLPQRIQIRRKTNRALFESDCRMAVDACGYCLGDGGRDRQRQ